jgi:arylsulfatase
MKNKTTVISLFSWILFIYFPLVSQAQTQKSNIIIILADDMGYSDIGSFGSEIKTPYLDALAKGGLIRLDAARKTIAQLEENPGFQ